MHPVLQCASCSVMESWIDSVDLFALDCCAEEDADAPAILMREIGACKLGLPLVAGWAALRAVAVYCSDGIPGREHRVGVLMGAILEEPERLFGIVESVQGEAQIPDEGGGEVCPEACGASI